MTKNRLSDIISRIENEKHTQLEKQENSNSLVIKKEKRDIQSMIIATNHLYS